MFNTSHGLFTPNAAVPNPPCALPPLAHGGFALSGTLQLFLRLAKFACMPKPKRPVERRDQQVGAMLKLSEREALDRFAEQFGMSRSQAARFLMLRGLSVMDTTFTPIEGD